MKNLFLQLSGNSIKENTKEDVLVGTLTAADVDANQLFLFRLIDSSDGLFVVENNELKVMTSNKHIQFKC